MVDTRALLKTFGEGVDSIAQIATDKAVNARRQTVSSFDITRGQLLENITLPATNPIPHSLGRVPKGALLLLSTGGVEVFCTKATVSTVTLTAPSSTTATVWVV